MQGKIDILLTPAKPYVGLSEEERLEVGKMMLKAGYRVEFMKLRPAGKTTGAVEHHMILDKGER